MIQIEDTYKTPIIPQSERANRERCTDTLAHLRVVYQHLYDAGKLDPFRATLTKLAHDIKAALGKESDGLDD